MLDVVVTHFSNSVAELQVQKSEGSPPEDHAGEQIQQGLFFCAQRCATFGRAGSHTFAHIGEHRVHGVAIVLKNLHKVV